MARAIKDHLPAVGVSSLRAAGAITLESISVKVTFGEGPDALEREVKVTHRLFPNGGSWSFFLCPGCSRRVRTLRLYDGRVVCTRCDGLTWTSAKTHGKKDIERLMARLERAKHSRGPLERSLRRAIIVERRKRLGMPS